jgi:GrpB-like predicted nucleotidyltransferase (UPF0157 family)
VNLKTDVPVTVPYDPRCPALFAREKEALLRLFTGTIVEIEHIGSTSVPGLGGEPVIDILLGVLDLKQIQDRIPALEGLGYRSVSELKSQNFEHQIFAKEAGGQHMYHLHAVEVRNEFWRHFLLFRDYLKAHKDIIHQYYELKVRLAEQFKHDRNAYTGAKSAFIKRILSEAEQGLCPFC